ncbi:hypothetical protein LC612_32475 [Nostoc sp. CHAB 5834]|nr:hypothetical protein [Nostoc sp. CHAB 5834]
MVPLSALLEHHLRFYNFPPEDFSYIPVLEHQLKSNTLLDAPHSKWVVLHKGGHAFARLTSSRELKRVAKPGDTALAVIPLRFLAERPVTLEMLKDWRFLAKELFEDFSHLVMLQVLTIPVLERSLEVAVPLQLAEQLGEVVKDVYSKAAVPLPLPLKQARVIEILAATWALGFDDDKSLSLAPLTCERLASGDFKKA